MSEIWYPGYGTSFCKYLQLETPFGRDLAGFIQRGSDNIASKVSEQTRSLVANNYQLKQTLGNGFDSVTNVINWGVDRIEFAIQDVNSSIESLHADFNYGMALIIEQAHLSNTLLSNLIDKLDDIHKTLQNPRLNESREFYRVGCERLSKGLLDKALESFKEAEKRNDTDIFTQFKIGKLYLYGVNEEVNVIDLEQAKLHLLYTARYAKSEKNVDSSFSYIEAEAYFHASIAIYAQLGDISNTENPLKYSELLLEASHLIKKAVNINPNFGEAFYHSAKYSALLFDSSDAIENLEKATQIDRKYAIKADVDHAFDQIRSDIVSYYITKKDKLKDKYILHYNKANALFMEALKWNFEESFLFDKFKIWQSSFFQQSKSFQSETIFGYLDAIEFYKVSIESLSEILNERKSSMKQSLINRINTENEILLNLGEGRLTNNTKYSIQKISYKPSKEIIELITKSRHHLNKAYSIIHSDISYMTYDAVMNAMNQLDLSYKLTVEAEKLTVLESKFR